MLGMCGVGAPGQQCGAEPLLAEGQTMEGKPSQARRLCPFGEYLHG